MSQRLGQHYDRYIKQNIDEFNKNDFNNLAISSKVDNFTPLSVINEPDIKYTTRVDYIVVSSSDRDITNYPSPSRYVFNLPFELKNIIRIEVVNGVIPDQNNVAREPYLLLNIDELESVMISNNSTINNGFALLHLASPIERGHFINVDKKTFEHVVLNLKTPKASLSKLTISIKDWQGNLFNFGDDTGGPYKALQNMFVFKIVTLEKNQEMLRQRNVY